MQNVLLVLNATQTYAAGGAAVCPRPVSPPVKGFDDLISCLSGLLDGVLVLYTGVLLLKQQLDRQINCYEENNFRTF